MQVSGIRTSTPISHLLTPGSNSIKLRSYLIRCRRKLMSTSRFLKLRILKPTKYTRRDRDIIKIREPRRHILRRKNKLLKERWCLRLTSIGHSLQCRPMMPIWLTQRVSSTKKPVNHMKNQLTLARKRVIENKKEVIRRVSLPRISSLHPRMMKIHSLLSKIRWLKISPRKNIMNPRLSSERSIVPAILTLRASYSVNRSFQQLKLSSDLLELKLTSKLASIEKPTQNARVMMNIVEGNQDWSLI